jgi:hypothetical protein
VFRRPARQYRRLNNIPLRRLPVTRQNLNDAVPVALFASPLQPSDGPTAEAVTQAIGRTMRELGPALCASRVAEEFRDHPETSAGRMRWARELAADLCGCLFLPAATPATPAPGTGLLPVREAA